MEEVLRRTSLAPLAFPCFVLSFTGVETEGLLDCQGRAGIVSIVPSDTKLLLTKNYTEIIIFGKLRISRVIP